MNIQSISVQVYNVIWERITLVLEYTTFSYCISEGSSERQEYIYYRNWLMKLWRLRTPTSAVWQLENQESQWYTSNLVHAQSLRTRETNGS